MRCDGAYKYGVWNVNMNIKTVRHSDRYNEGQSDDNDEKISETVVYEQGIKSPKYPLHHHTSFP